MQATMMHSPMTVQLILEHGASVFPDSQVGVFDGDTVSHTSYREVAAGAVRLAAALDSLGVAMGDRVGTFSWNNRAHMEAYLAIPSMGAVMHTINIRLATEQMAYIINHAEDKVIILDASLRDVFAPVVPLLKTVEHILLVGAAEALPDINCLDYDQLLASQPATFDWPELEETSAAAICYTSGTTGNPKGVVYSHRTTFVHSLASRATDTFGVCERDCILLLPSMFHANAWALTYAVPSAGAKMVMPGAGMDGKSIYELLENERVTATAAVPTVWLGLLQYLEQTGKNLPYLNRVVVGGAACPPMMIRKFELDYDVEVIHGWGMTEMSPVGTTGKMKHATSLLDREGQLKLKEKQGRSPYLVEMKIVDDDGNDLPRDGKAFGHLLVKGPAVAKGYYRLDVQTLTDDGWFDTGDIATIDPLGFMQITDRDKDVIKSGGEWISSIEIENVAVGCEGVAEAAVIGLPHVKWSERPLLIVVRDVGSNIDKQTVLDFLEGKIARWWMPDDVQFVDEIPHTATGKIQKMTLREQFSDYEFKT